MDNSVVLLLKVMKINVFQNPHFIDRLAFSIDKLLDYWSMNRTFLSYLSVREYNRVVRQHWHHSIHVVVQHFSRQLTRQVQKVRVSKQRQLWRLTGQSRLFIALHYCDRKYPGIKTVKMYYNRLVNEIGPKSWVRPIMGKDDRWSTMKRSFSHQ